MKSKSKVLLSVLLTIIILTAMVIVPMTAGAGSLEGYADLAMSSVTSAPTSSGVGPETPTGTIIVHKVISNDTTDMETEFSFGIYSEDYEANGTVTQTTGTALYYVPYGEYQITEYSKSGYSLVGMDGDVDDSETGYLVTVGKEKTEITITNKKEFSISIEKTVNGQRSITAYPGDEVTYNFKVKNTGSLVLDYVVIFDNMRGINLEKELPEPLEAGEEYETSVKYTIPSYTIPGTVITNTATVEAYYYGEDIYPTQDQLTFDGEELEFPYTSETATAIINVTTRPAIVYQVYSNNLTVAKTGEGTVSPAVGSHSYPIGTNVTLSATPADGWKFDGWTGATTAESVTMNSDKTVTAVFSQIAAAIAEPVAEEPVAAGSSRRSTACIGNTG